MQKNKTLTGRAIKAMLAASFAVAMFPTSVFADVRAEQNVQAQNQQQIKGNVVDEFGEPMIGVTIKVKGSIEATITDLDGNFTIKAAPNATLELSYVGYVTENIKASAAQKVQMKPDSQMMDEVVVIGFGTVKKRDVTGSVSSVKADQLLQAPTSDVATSLQGRVTGLDVSGGELRIRGNRSINGSNEPLVIIDGVQGGSMSDINPQDVESIDVLKDASSTAIYGSQGANGVIIITTKKAEVGKMSISYDGSATAAFRPDHPDFRTGENYYNALLDANKAAGKQTDDLSVLGSAEAVAAYKAGAGTNYEDLLMRSTTWSTKHTVTLSGGTEKTSARVSIGYAGNGDKWKKSGTTDRYTLRGVMDYKMYKWISAGINFQLTHNRSKNSPYAKSSVTDWRLGSPYGAFEDGKYVITDQLQERPLTSVDYVNPLIDADVNDLFSSASHSTHAVANVYLDIHPIDGLTFRTQFNTSLSNSTSGSYTDGAQSSVLNDKGGSIADPSGTNTATMSASSSSYVEWNNILTYNFTQLPKDHHLGVTLLSTYSYKLYDYLWAQSLGQTLASNLWYNLGSDNGSRSHSSNYKQSQTLSYAGRISYDWQSRYLFTASLRRDGASRLADGHKWDWFPSAALAWRITDEKFMEKVKGNWLDDLKLRATYGVTGNAGISEYGTKSGVTAATTGLGFQDVAGNRYVIGRSDGGNYLIGNKDTKWEKSTTFDLGFDAFLFNNRINVVFDWYNTKTSDVILLRQLPTSAGAAGTYAIYTNIGDVQNRGVEFTINARIIDNKKFKWNSALTFSANSEKIVNLVDGKDITTTKDKEASTLMIGHPIKSFNTFTYDGIWKTSEADEAAIFGQQPGGVRVIIPNMEKTGAGEYTKYDKDGNVVGKYTKDNPYAINQAEDVGYVGSTTPKWFAGFNNDFNIGNFDVNLYFYARFGQWAESRMATYQPGNGGKYVNMDYWKAGENEDALLPGIYSGRPLYDYTGYQSLWYADNSFIKLKRITLGYTLPKDVLKKINVNKIRIYATVNDPLYWVKSDFQKGYDPENNQRSVTVGLNINL